MWDRNGMHTGFFRLVIRGTFSTGKSFIPGILTYVHHSSGPRLFSDGRREVDAIKSITHRLAVTSVRYKRAAGTPYSFYHQLRSPMGKSCHKQSEDHNYCTWDRRVFIASDSVFLRFAYLWWVTVVVVVTCPLRMVWKCMYIWDPQASRRGVILMYQKGSGMLLPSLLPHHSAQWYAAAVSIWPGNGCFDHPS